MSSKRELLELRKQVLVARASLQRLQVAAQVERMRSGLRLPRAASAVLASPQGRSIAFGALLFVARRFRVLRLVRFGIAALAAAKLVRTVLDARAAGAHEELAPLPPPGAAAGEGAFAPGPGGRTAAGG